MPTEWTDEQLATLRRTWSEASRIADIAKEIGHSEPSISKKAREIGLPSRRQNAQDGLLVSCIPREGGLGGSDMVNRCLWPFGNPGEKDFHLCGTTVVPGKPYCAEHCKKAYLPRNEEREEDHLQADL